MIITSNIPKLDLHGEISSMVEVLVNEFIHDNVIYENETVAIIHGISGGIIKKEVHEVLKNNINVKEFKIDSQNPGMTIAILKI